MQELSKINLSGDEIPIRCTMMILEDIQKEFGSLTDFSDKLIPTKKNKDGEAIISGQPDLHAVVYALPKFVNEGIEQYNTEHKIQIERMTAVEIFRKCNLSVMDTALIIYKEFWRSINAPKQLPPEQTNQKESNQKNS